MPAVLIDAGPMAALLNTNDERHDWTRQTMQRLPAPALTSEPALTEAAFLLTRDGFDADDLFALAAAGMIKVGIEFDREHVALRSLIRKYQDVPMSLADATLIRLSELHSDCRILTFDAHFQFYRRHGNKIIPLVMPEQ
jgi:uncharacterized protein